MVETNAEGEKAKAIEKIKTSSGRLNRAEPVILHESSRSQVQFISSFIPRSSGVESLIFKIVVYRKAPQPEGWKQVERESPWISEEAARKLLPVLQQHLAVAESPGEGRHIVIKVQEGVGPSVDIQDPQRIAQALVGVLKQQDILQHFLSMDLGDGLAAAVRGSIRIQELKTALATLRSFLDGGIVEEREYQKWCEVHSWAFGNAYVMTDEVRRISAGDQVDLLLRSTLNGLRDIIELKRPDVDVLRYDEARGCHYFSPDSSLAIGQCHRYLDVLHQGAAAGLLDHPEIVAYHPRAIVVIGRSAGWTLDKLKALHGLNSRLHGISVMTFDQLLSMGERLVESLGDTLGGSPINIEASSSEEDIPY